MHKVAFLLLGLGLFSTVVACSNETEIVPEKMKPTPGSGGSSNVAVSSVAVTNGVGTSVTAVGTTTSDTTGNTAVTVTTSASTGGACCDQPIQVQGPVSVRTADTDANQAFDVTTPQTFGTLTPIIQGPAYLTDFANGNGGNASIYVYAGSSCPVMQPGDVPIVSFGDLTAQHGARWFVAANHIACSNLPVHVAGFRPY